MERLQSRHSGRGSQIRPWQASPSASSNAPGLPANGRSRRGSCAQRARASPRRSPPISPGRFSSCGQLRSAPSPSRPRQTRRPRRSPSGLRGAGQAARRFRAKGAARHRRAARARVASRATIGAGTRCRVAPDARRRPVRPSFGVRGVARLQPAHRYHTPRRISMHGSKWRHLEDRRGGPLRPSVRMARPRYRQVKRAGRPVTTGRGRERR